MDRPDYYALLGVAKDADLETIRKAYRSLAFSCHPDVNPDDPEAAGRFAALAEAFAVLAAPDSRAAYDRTRRAVVPVQGPGVTVRDGSFADNAFFVAPKARDWRPGADVRWNLDIPEAVAHRGGTLRFTFGEDQICASCGGSGRLARTCWVCHGRGSILKPAGPVTLADRCPSCDGRGLAVMPCPACLGKGRLRARQGTVTVPPGVATGDVLVVPGSGAPGQGGAPAGNLLLVARVIAASTGRMA